MGPKAKMPRIKIKSLKAKKPEKMTKEMMAADAMLIKQAEVVPDPVGLNTDNNLDSDCEALEIDENDQFELMSDCESEKGDETENKVEIYKKY